MGKAQIQLTNSVFTKLKNTVISKVLENMNYFSSIIILNVILL